MSSPVVRRFAVPPAIGVLLLLLASVGLAAPPLSPARLLSASDASIRFEVSAPAPRLVPGPDSTVSPRPLRLELDGFANGVAADATGLPGCIVTLAVPPLGNVTVSAAGAESETHDGLVVDDGSSLRPRMPAGIRPGVRARLLGVGWMRNQRVARVAVFPADYDAAARRLVVYRHIEVEVQVEPMASLGPPAEDPDPFELVYRDGLLNYEQGRAWRRPSTRRLVQRAALQPDRLASFASAVPETSVYAGRRWIKIAVTKSGFYKVSYAQLRNFSMFSLDRDSVRFSDLRLFNWPGVPVLPENSYCDSCDYREVAIGMVDNGDGFFTHNSDAFYFYAMGPNDWANLYDPAQPETVYVNHPYDTQNYYYLTRSTRESPVGGTAARITVDPVPGTVTDPALTWPVTYPARDHWEQDIEYWPDASPLYNARFGVGGPQWFEWEKWFWKSVAPGTSYTVTEALPGADTSQVWVRALVWGINADKYHPQHQVQASFNGEDFPLRIGYFFEAMVFESTFTNANTTANRFTLGVPYRPSYPDLSGLAWVEFYYRRHFEPVNDELAFDSPDSTRSVNYRVGPFARLVGAPRVFDVTRPWSPVEIVGAAYDTTGGHGWLSFHAEETGRRHYRVIMDDMPALPPQNLVDAPAMSLENLRSSTEQADYILIYYDGFRTAADALTSWRTQHLSLPGVDPPYAVKAIPISALYDQFSGGRVDPAAIRNFLRAAFYNWNAGGSPRRPAFVTFLGNASFDFKNLKGYARAGQPGCLLPSFENNFDPGALDIEAMKQFDTDDWLLNVDDPRTVIPDFYGGRIPVGDAATALAVVNSKVIGYESAPALGEWRNRIMLIADDTMQGKDPDPVGAGHVLQTMTLDDLAPPHLDRDYAYLSEYPSTPNYLKPICTADIMRYLNDGVALMNFVGHGSSFQLADEKVLVNTDAGTLSNAPRFPIFISASCDVGKFNDPGVPGLGQALLSNPNGGAAGVISSSEVAISGWNALLNQTIYRQLFSRDGADCQYHVPVAAALLAAKGGRPNEQKYQLMGDAAIHISLPRLWVDLALKDSLGHPVDRIQRGQVLTAYGRVLTCPGGDPVPMSGVASLRISDSPEIRHLPNTSVYFRYTAGTIYRGDVGLSNGAFSERFIVPLDARDGGYGRVRAYVEGRVPGETADTDGAGADTVSVFAPAAEDTSISDHSGPRISLSFVGGATRVPPDATLRIDLYDPSGILTTDHSPQNGIIVTLDGNPTTRRDVTDSFRYAADSYQSGAAYYALTNAPLGAHTITVSAADNMAAGLTAGANRSKASLSFTVVAESELRIAHAYLFPNPIESKGGGGGGQFVVDAPGDSINLLLRIYTVSGRLVRTLKSFGGLGQVQIPWDGLDDEGSPLANGVYFFRVHVNARDPDGTSSPRQEADSDGRFVVVNRR